MTDTILVPGATGALGSALVRQLAEKGVKVRAGVHTPQKTEGLQKADSVWGKNIEAVPLDLDNPEDVDRAVRGVTKIVLISPPLSATQVEIAANVLEVALAEKVQYVVRISFLGTERKESGALGMLNLQVEKLVRESGIPYTILRPPGFMQNFLTSMRPHDGVLYAAAGESKNSFVDTADVAAPTEKGHDGRVYEPTGPEALSLGEIAAILSVATGKTVKYVALSDEAAREALAGAGLPEHAIQGLLDLMSLQRTGYAAAVTTDVKDVAGCDPTSFAEFAKAHASEF